MLEQETEEKIKDRETALSERVPPLNLSGLSLQELQVFHLIQFSMHIIILSLISALFCGGHILLQYHWCGIVSYFSTGSMQRLAPQAWCCWWGEVWYWSQGVQKYQGGELLTLAMSEWQDKKMHVELITASSVSTIKKRSQLKGGPNSKELKMNKHCLQVAAVRITWNKKQKNIAVLRRNTLLSLLYRTDNSPQIEFNTFLWVFNWAESDHFMAFYRWVWEPFWESTVARSKMTVWQWITVY